MEASLKPCRYIFDTELYTNLGNFTVDHFYILTKGMLILEVVVHPILDLVATILETKFKILLPQVQLDPMDQIFDRHRILFFFSL